MKAIQVIGHGKIDEVSKLLEMDLPEIKDDEVLLDMLASPINPSDILAIKGLYPRKYSFPEIFGNEGIGRVVTIGSKVTHVKQGDLVLLPSGNGTWRSQIICPGKRVFALPEGDIHQLSMISVNPPTAYLMLKEFVELDEGDWIIQNAANSAVGRYIIQLAKIRGIKTVNIVRRESLISELKDLGADVVLVDGPDLPKQVKSALDGATIKLGIDAVSGEASDRMIRCLGQNATLVVYGAMSLDLIKVNMAVVMSKNLTIKPFWLSRWYQETDRKEVQHTLGYLIGLISKGELAVKIAGTYPLDEFKDALKHADTEAKDGKVLFVGY
ncbi:MAG: zinc-dependent alcohol dehydrogenase family protein [Candidatus Heimdallarchaeota archaeon]|nr:zinc-dependent alcohol dehydrogenase family protein [Candidatus Heimdallarchaeota archaeon]